MSKGRSNHSLTPGDDKSLPRSKILRGRKNFKRLFERDAHVVRNQFVDVRYKIIDDSTFGCLMGFIAPKHLGKAHKRNRMKRLLKEAYRLHQHMLSEPLEQSRFTLHGALLAKSTNVSYDAVEQNVIDLLDQVREQLPTISPGKP